MYKALQLSEMTGSELYASQPFSSQRTKQTHQKFLFRFGLHGEPCASKVLCHAKIPKRFVRFAGALNRKTSIVKQFHCISCEYVVRWILYKIRRMKTVGYRWSVSFSCVLIELKRERVNLARYWFAHVVKTFCSFCVCCLFYLWRR